MSPSLTLEYLPAVVSSVELNDLICILQRGPDAGFPVTPTNRPRRGVAPNFLMSVAGGGGGETNPFYSALSLSVLRFLGFGQEQIGEQFVRLSGGKTAPLLSSVAGWPLKREGGACNL